MKGTGMKVKTSLRINPFGHVVVEIAGPNPEEARPAMVPAYRGPKSTQPGSTMVIFDGDFFGVPVTTDGAY